MRIYDQQIMCILQNDAHLKFSLPYVPTEFKKCFKILPC